VRKLAHEVRIGCSLVHPNIVTTLGRVLLPGPFPALVLELMAGGSLSRYLHERTQEQRQSQPMAHELKLQLVREVALGLSYLHDCGIVHRDIKTSNVLLTDQPNGVDLCVHAKLSDFGIATRFGMELTSDVGTTRYMAPEVIFGPYNHRADIYSYSLLLWEVMHEAVPFPNVSSVAALLMLKDNARPHCDVPHRVSQDLAALIKSCWQESPSHRPLMAEVLDALRRVQLEAGRG
jgi:serine/threonine protein kinase